MFASSPGIGLRMGRPRWIAFAVILLAGLTLAFAARSQRSSSPGPVVLIDIKGAIGFVSVGFLTKALEKAETQNASALIVRLDTPGGLVFSTREMISVMLGSRVPVVVYVAPSGARAASAGTFLIYGSHVAAMAPGTHLGAATPVPVGMPGMPGSPPSKPEPGKEKPADSDSGTTLNRKSVNDAVAYIRTLAQLRNRNAEWAEKAVREAATLTAGEALKERVIDLIASDPAELLSALDGRSVTTAAGEMRLATKGRPIVEFLPDWKMQVLAVIADPNIAIILLLIGIYGIFFEFMTPGVVAPGVIGAICLLVALTGLSMLPVSYGGLSLLLLGIALMLFEAFSPGFGIVGLGGVVAFVLGALFLFDPGDADIKFGVSWQVIVGAAAGSVALSAGVFGFALKARHRAVITGAEALIGSDGEVVDWSGGEGRIRVLGEIWTARAGRHFAQGQPVRVVNRSGLVLTVEAT